MVALWAKVHIFNVDMVVANVQDIRVVTTRTLHGDVREGWIVLGVRVDCAHVGCRVPKRHGGNDLACCQWLNLVAFFALVGQAVWGRLQVHHVVTNRAEFHVGICVVAAAILFSQQQQNAKT